MFAAIACIKKCTEYVPVDLEVPERHTWHGYFWTELIIASILLCAGQCTCIQQGWCACGTVKQIIGLSTSAVQKLMEQMGRLLQHLSRNRITTRLHYPSHHKNHTILHWFWFFWPQCVASTWPLKVWDATLALENHSVEHFLHRKKLLENLLLVFQCIDVLII